MMFHEKTDIPIINCNVYVLITYFNKKDIKLELNFIDKIISDVIKNKKSFSVSNELIGDVNVRVNYADYGCSFDIIKTIDSCDEKLFSYPDDYNNIGINTLSNISFELKKIKRKCYDVSIGRKHTWFDILTLKKLADGEYDDKGKKMYWKYYDQSKLLLVSELYDSGNLIRVRTHNELQNDLNNYYLTTKIHNKFGFEKSPHRYNSSHKRNNSIDMSSIFNINKQEKQTTNEYKRRHHKKRHSYNATQTNYIMSFISKLKTRSNRITPHDTINEFN